MIALLLMHVIHKSYPISNKNTYDLLNLANKNSFLQNLENLYVLFTSKKVVLIYGVTAPFNAEGMGPSRLVLLCDRI